MLYGKFDDQETAWWTTQTYKNMNHGLSFLFDIGDQVL